MFSNFVARHKEDLRIRCLILWGYCDVFGVPNKEVVLSNWEYLFQLDAKVLYLFQVLS